MQELTDRGAYLFQQLHSFEAIYVRYKLIVGRGTTGQNMLTDIRDVVAMYRDNLDMFLEEHAGHRP